MVGEGAAARTAVLSWGGWLTVTAVVFSFMNGIVHSYYTVALAPSISALVAISAHVLWQHRSEQAVTRAELAAVLHRADGVIAGALG